MKYAINGFKNSNKEVRDAAFSLIMNVYKFIGEGVRSYFKDLRPAQVNMLEEGFENVDGLGNNEGGNDQEEPYENNEIMNESQLIFAKNKDKKNEQPKKSNLKSNTKNNDSFEDNEGIYNNI